MDSQPVVTIVVPAQNEEHFIARCLDAIVSQDYPSDRIEILVVDGMSNDRTREIVGELAQRDARVTLLDNPQRIVPSALNRGIRAARGALIMIVGGHTLIAPDYVTRCVAALCAQHADNAGGPMRARGDTHMARGIALATSSPFGVGSARFHYAEQACWVDTVYMGAYRREVFERVGLFDEELVRNQDDEFNFRLIRAGGKIWLDPSIRSTYFSRATLRALWKQYFQYGYWKVRVIQKHGRPASWRHLAPGAFLLALLGAAIVSALAHTPIWFLIVAMPYALASIAVSLWVAARNGWQYAPLLPPAFAVMHLAYGSGFLAGVFRFVLRVPRIAGPWPLRN